MSTTPTDTLIAEVLENQKKITETLEFLKEAHLQSQANMIEGFNSIIEKMRETDENEKSVSDRGFTSLSIDDLLTGISRLKDYLEDEWISDQDKQSVIDDMIKYYNEGNVKMMEMVSNLIINR